MNIIDSLKNEMIVSCQAEGTDPFNTPEYVALFAKAVMMGGAKAIRAEGIEKIRKIKECVNLPIIGLVKSAFSDGYVRITGTEDDVISLLEVGCDIVAIDGTFRIREGLSGPDFISKIKRKYNCTVLADISTYKEAVACQYAGADCVSTTLSGYTPDTIAMSSSVDFSLIEKLCKNLQIPVFAEGRINTPEDASKVMSLGAYAVITGTAITRPRIITQWFVQSIKKRR